MDHFTAQHIGAGLAMTGLIGAPIGIGLTVGNYLLAAMRNPAAAASERIWMIIGVALAESMGIFGLLLGLLILFT
jgi:F-type H+-transporting ATPase subunit c